MQSITEINNSKRGSDDKLRINKIRRIRGANIAGFFLYKLFGLVKHKEKPEGKVMEQVLSVWGAKGKFPILFLIPISDQFYLFIIYELVVRRGAEL